MSFEPSDVIKHFHYKMLNVPKGEFTLQQYIVNNIL